MKIVSIDYRTFRSDIRTTERFLFQLKVYCFPFINMIDLFIRVNVTVVITPVQIKFVLHRHYSLPFYFRFTNHILRFNSLEYFF